MTLTELQSKLLTHNPRLLSCAEAGLSEGPWKYYASFIHCPPERKAERQDHGVITNGERIAVDVSEQNARFIAATNGEQPWAELLWEIYTENERRMGTLWVLKAVKSMCYDIHEQNLKILLALDAAGRLGWTEKGGEGK